MDNAVSAGMLKRCPSCNNSNKRKQLQLKADQHNLDVGTANLAAAQRGRLRSAGDGRSKSHRRRHRSAQEGRCDARIPKLAARKRT